VKTFRLSRRAFSVAFGAGAGVVAAYLCLELAFQALPDAVEAAGGIWSDFRKFQASQKGAKA
jgi:hypothetical protein